MKPRMNGENRSPNATKHGLTTLKWAVKALGGRVIDRRTTIGRALSQWRSDLIRDLGGEATVSTQQLALVHLAVKSKLLMDSVDARLLTQKSLINGRKKALLPVVRERTQLADSLARYLGQLGLERKAKVIDLARALQEASRPSEGNPTPSADGESPPNCR